MYEEKNRNPKGKTGLEIFDRNFQYLHCHKYGTSNIVASLEVSETLSK